MELLFYQVLFILLVLQRLYLQPLFRQDIITILINIFLFFCDSNLQILMFILQLFVQLYIFGFLFSKVQIFPIINIHISIFIILFPIFIPIFNHIVDILFHTHFEFLCFLDIFLIILFILVVVINTPDFLRLVFTNHIQIFFITHPLTIF